MNYTCVTTINEIRAYLAGARLVAFSVTAGPGPDSPDKQQAARNVRGGPLTGISLSVREGSAIYIPLRHQGGPGADPDLVLPCLRQAVFENPRIEKAAHNLAGAAMLLYGQGIVVVPPCYDTAAAAQLTLKSPGVFRPLADCALQTLAAQLLGDTLPDPPPDQCHMLDANDPQTGQAARFACACSDYTLRLRSWCNRWFEKNLPAHRRIARDLESPAAVYCGLMRYNGLPIDTRALYGMQVRATGKLAELRSEIARITGGVPIGANASTAAFRAYLYGTLALPVIKTTAKQQPAMDDEALTLLAEHCRLARPGHLPLFDLVQQYRRWGKLKSTYLDGYLRHVNKQTGRIHAEFLPLGTETGRFAASNPNVQNCPRSSNDPVGIRSLITAPEGCLLLSLDFSQIELRVGAFYCRDANMLQTYRTPHGDIHAGTTAVIYGITHAQAADKSAPHYKERRAVAKSCNFGVFYGLYPRGLQKNLKLKAGLATSLAQCTAIIDNLNAGYPGLARWQQTVKRQARDRGYSETWLGRRRYLPGIRSAAWGTRSAAERCALNTPIQGTAADILKCALARILHGLPARPWLRPVLQIHDELVFEVPAGKVGEAAAFIRRCMEAPPFKEFDVPITADAACGPNFGAMGEMEREHVNNKLIP